MFKFKFARWIFLFTSHTLFATQFTVLYDTDNNPGGSGEMGELRYYLNLMNQNLNATFDEYTIIFDPSITTIQLNGILPIINNSSNFVSITIGNPDPTSMVTIDGNSGAYSGFFIPMGNVTIQNMVFQNLTAKGGNGGDGISGGGGGMGAGGAIYAPQTFLNGSNPSITLINVEINGCSAVGGNGGSYINGLSGNEGGAGGGGFSGNGGSIMTNGMTGGGGGGGFGGDGGDVYRSFDNDVLGGGGGGGGGLGSRANPTYGTPANLGNGGSDQDYGLDGDGYGLTITAGSGGGGGNNGGNNAGGGGGGAPITESSLPGGGGGGSLGSDGLQAEGPSTPGGGVIPSGGNGGDGGGGGGGGVVTTSSTTDIDGQAGSGGYGGGGGGGAGLGGYGVGYTVQGGSGGVGGGGGGGGVDQSNITFAGGGSSLGGGGGGGGGPSNGSTASGGTDIGSLGGGSGGNGANTYGSGGGGGGGGGGSGLGGAIFVDSGLNFTIQALSGIPTTFNTSNNTTQAGSGGTGDPGGTNGTPGSSLGDSIFLRTGSSLTLMAQNANDLLTLGDQVTFTDDSSFTGEEGTNIFVGGNGTVVYNGMTDYQGTIVINNANFKVNGTIDAPISVCRNINVSAQRGMLSGSGTMTGNVYVNSGTISPDTGETLTLGSLTLNSAALGALGSLVYIEIDSSGTSLVSVTGSTTLAGTLEIDLDPSATPGTYTILTSSTITGTFDTVTFTGPTPNYSLSYLPSTNPTFVQFDFLGYAPLAPSNLQGTQKKNDFGIEYEFYNQLTWTPSPSTATTGYFIYRDGQKIAAVNASTYTYEDHNRKKGVSYTYAITAFASDGSESSPITIVITP